MKSWINFHNITYLFFFLILVVTFSCKKDNSITPNETGIMSDIDGNVYKTVKIGNQWWMAENLKVKRYRNGDTIQFVGLNGYNLDSSKWNNINSGAYCIIDNLDSTSKNFNGKEFGFLYNGFTIIDSRIIAPAGWHIPTDAEWKTLEMFLGMSDIEANKTNWRGKTEGNKLKLQSGWSDLPENNSNYLESEQYYIYGSNESGFSALGGGCCMYNGTWSDPQTFASGFWWTSSFIDNNIIYRYLDYHKPYVFRYYALKTYGFNIRCVKD
ncbi:MAG: fibrobacter succinogenes major paralogous domain-containing protein [Bacteroidetes bacterium]|nr:fibrobacter succinogenes major paralogous domain-containing protein [Bacteroidota bacterium]